MQEYAGLAAARKLTNSGKSVIVLEARDYTGGRIHTLNDAGFTIPIETGAEFVHGNLPHTKALIKEAGLSLKPVEGEFYQIKNGKLQEDNLFDEMPKLLSKVDKLEHDVPLSVFLEKYYSDDKFSALRDSIKRYAAGYDSADVQRLSIYALRDEWMSEQNESQDRIIGGYSKLTDFLEEKAEHAGGEIHLSTVVKEIHWEKGKVEIKTNNKIYKSEKVLVTVPVGVLNSEERNKGYISFQPEINKYRDAFKLLGFGSVIKIFLEFQEAFWLENNPAHSDLRKISEPGFIFSDALIPTWWTQNPDKIPILTGWLSGPDAANFANTDEMNIVPLAVDSLSYVFNIDKNYLQKQLKSVKVMDWNKDPFTKGAYSYLTVESKGAINMLTTPISDTIYFAGEALYDGAAMGTTEAALDSGITAVKRMI